MKPLALSLVVLCILIGCSSEDDADDSTTTNKANPCATPGASYLWHCTEQSGDCGPTTDEVINVSSDGTLAQSITCAKFEQDGCTGRGTDCKQSTNGCTILTTFQTTFLADGSSADNVMTATIDCDDGSHCKSTYQCTYTRQ